MELLAFYGVESVMGILISEVVYLRGRTFLTRCHGLWSDILMGVSIGKPVTIGLGK